ncbi:hypothetical protein MMC07_002710 [Pseudocyphellaria aurata]|nr:hypothetical protein [Pseudocyphellaria aurata]
MDFSFLSILLIISTIFEQISCAIQIQDAEIQGRHLSHGSDQAVLDDNFLQSPLDLPGHDTVIQDEFDIQKSSDIPPTFSALLDAIEVMQEYYFKVWAGTWPRAIDWTAAVMGTHISATLSSLSEFKGDHSKSKGRHDESRRSLARQNHENLINQYFTQITSFYFGQNAFSLRTQAFDDMLWVVLGWLETVKFINLHSQTGSMTTQDVSDLKGHPKTAAWYGRQFIPQFAHRARLFYDLAFEGWDTTLCNGGMIWNPYLTPYKNAITNQLFIAASIGMYFDFPGDDNSSPFTTERSTEEVHAMPPAKAHDQKYLDAAIEGYRWLSTSNMTNEQGLYVDGFHIQGWSGGKNGSQGSGKCDVRDEMVYTYNQGVVLSGLRGLWRATGSISYLEDGHELIENVISATGWQQRHNKDGWNWAGLGRNGVLEEACDSSGTCSQDGHTFKGIFFHHLTIFCAPLPKKRFDRNGQTVPVDDDVARLHRNSCDGYGIWIRHNARAAYLTRDSQGKFGTWWGRPFQQIVRGPEEHYTSTTEGTDYRNKGVPMDELWRLPIDLALQDEEEHMREADMNMPEPVQHWRSDPNDRGRGRTVETQSGGLAVLRALWHTVGRRKILIDLNEEDA